MTKKKRKIKNNKKPIKKIKFVNPLYIVILVVMIVIAFLISFIFSMRCWDGVNINEEGIMKACGVSVDEFYQLTEINESFCMDGWTYVRAVAKCGPKWGIIVISILAASVVYNIIYLIYFLVKKRHGHKKRVLRKNKGRTWK